jgi:hypothetical protein
LLRELLGIVLKREEAISVLKELLDNCSGLDGHYFELSSSNVSSLTMGGYQITIKTALDEETKKCIQEILMKHQLTYQAGSMWKTKRSINKTDPDTFIIYKPKDNALAAGKPLPSKRP